MFNHYELKEGTIKTLNMIGFIKCLIYQEF